VNTVRSYSQQLYGKLGVGSRTPAITRARELGLLA
jgi:ATP/maltotriose-dependent transcriptional regulator MalT